MKNPPPPPFDAEEFVADDDEFGARTGTRAAGRRKRRPRSAAPIPASSGSTNALLLPPFPVVVVLASAAADSCVGSAFAFAFVFDDLPFPVSAISRRARSSELTSPHATPKSTRHAPRPALRCFFLAMAADSNSSLFPSSLPFLPWIFGSAVGGLGRLLAWLPNFQCVAPAHKFFDPRRCMSKNAYSFPSARPPSMAMSRAASPPPPLPNRFEAAGTAVHSGAPGPSNP
mmetsp:Transcript_71095/g.122159  ORF Transcript_71095/g.122159 Transcript_71095/m.122159 type:complete len:229 (-) Transcript_71095:209-895(-)